jgi:hypothetical protein
LRFSDAFTLINGLLAYALTGMALAFALTYGPEVDWYRNVLAAGQCSLLWHGRTYALEQPEPFAMQAALPLYSPFKRMILRRLGTRDFVHMKRQSAGAPGTQPALEGAS